MTTEDSLLKFTKREVVSSTTFIHQVDNGTLFYRNEDCLWVMKDGQKIKVEFMHSGIPIEIMFRDEYRNALYEYLSITVVHNDSIYYCSNWARKIYRAKFNPLGVIETYYVRDLQKGERIHHSGLCSLVCNGKLYVYRMCDDPFCDRKPVDIPVDTLEWLELKGLYGDTAIFAKITKEPIMPSVTRMGKDAIVLSCFRGNIQRGFMGKLFSNKKLSEFHSPWSSSALVKQAYVYMTNGKTIFVIDPVTSKMLPPLYFCDVSCFHIAGINDGTLIGRGKCKNSGKYHLMTAQLPHEYVVKTQSIPNGFSPIDDAQMGAFRSKFENEFMVKKIRGKGGFGCVFEAVNKYDDWEYAVKRVAVDLIAVESALREVKAMAQLDHPHIIRYNASWVENPPGGWQRDRDVDLMSGLGETKKSLRALNYDCVFIYIQM
ncbi:hypothetical protein PENTCL1PPCAC_4515, partial [Pristionchus entomophagus]